MAANLSPEYKEAEKNYKAAKTPEEKLRFLELMLSTIPKHKGTEKLQAELKSKIARFEIEDKGKGGGGRRGAMFNVSREGAGQVALVGAPNAGKSSILGGTTKANPEIAPYPYTTQMPQPGMAPYQNIKIQLVDLPPISPDFYESWIAGIIRNADIALLVASLASDDVLDETEYVLNRLKEGKLELVREVTHKLKPDGTAQVKTHLVCTHADAPQASDVLELVRETFKDRFEIWTVSNRDPQSLAALVHNLFVSLDIVRIYTKQPGKQADRSDPVILPKGSILLDFATSIHKDLARNLKFARIWGKSKYDGQKVNRDYVLEDEDVVELHA